VFDVVNFDMINMVKLDYVPRTCAWTFKRGSAQATLAVAVEDSPEIRFYDGRSADSKPIEVVSVHSAPVVALAYYEGFDLVISADKKGMVEYWDASTREFPEQYECF